MHKNASEHNKVKEETPKAQYDLFKTSPHFAVKLRKCFVNYETSLDLPSTWVWVFIFGWAYLSTGTRGINSNLDPPLRHTWLADQHPVLHRLWPLIRSYDPGWCHWLAALASQSGALQGRRGVLSCGWGSGERAAMRFWLGCTAVWPAGGKKINEITVSWLFFNLHHWVQWKV